MEYYFRVIKKMEQIDCFEGIGFVPCIEVFKTKDYKFVENINSRIKRRFRNVKDFEACLTNTNLRTFQFIKKEHITPIRHKMENYIYSHKIDNATYEFLYWE